MQLKEMRLGKSLEINICRDDYHLDMVSKIEAVEENKVYVSLIVGRTRVFQFAEGDSIEIIYNIGDRLYKWKDVQGAIVNLDGEYVHCLEVNGPSESYNRRESYRVYLGEKVKLTIVDSKFSDIAFYESELNKTDNRMYVRKDVEAYVNDISESGLSIYTHEKMNVEDVVRLQLYTEQGEIEGVYEVVRIEEQHQNNYGTFYGLRCLKVTNNLTKFIFAEQRKRIRYTRMKE